MKQRRDKIDSNQKSIVKALRDIPGASVDVGHDDILVGTAKKTFWYEVKDKSCFSKRTGMIKESAKTPKQKKLDLSWHGHREYVSSIDDIIEDIRNNLKR